MLKEPIVPGKLCQIEIHRGYFDLGLQLVGGCDTPLITTIIQQIKPNSVAERDGRLLPGDHILRLNGNDLTTCSHREVINLFAQAIPICTMMIYRETLDDSTPNLCYEYREEIVKVAFEKHVGQHIGIKLGHRK
jgi:ligand of Numb protein X 1/2